MRGSFVLLFICFCADALVEGWGAMLAFQSKNNLWLYNIAVPLLGTLWMSLFAWWSRSNAMRILFTALIFGLLALSMTHRGSPEFNELLDDITFTYFSL